MNKEKRGIGVFERYLTVWVLFCIGAGIVLGKLAPNVSTSLDKMATVVGVLIEVPVMLMLVKICLKSQHWFKTA